MKNIKRIKYLEELLIEGEAQMQLEGYTVQEIKKEIKERRASLVKNLNRVGWVFVFLIIFPLACMQLGLTIKVSFFVSYVFGGIISVFIVPKLTGHYP